jgi:hypothetical protein
MPRRPPSTPWTISRWSPTTDAAGSLREPNAPTNDSSAGGEASSPPALVSRRRARRRLLGPIGPIGPIDSIGTIVLTMKSLSYESLRPVGNDRARYRRGAGRSPAGVDRRARLRAWESGPRRTGNRSAGRRRRVRAGKNSRMSREMGPKCRTNGERADLARDWHAARKRVHRFGMTRGRRIAPRGGSWSCDGETEEERLRLGGASRRTDRAARNDKERTVADGRAGHRSRPFWLDVSSGVGGAGGFPGVAPLHPRSPFIRSPIPQFPSSAVSPFSFGSAP